jgi:2-oxoglutarate dehydrogenase E2 component (dihydrolipoamide succinyltransferase)
MAVEIKVPSVGESIAEGMLVRWLKNDGALVRVDEPLFELETEKATTEVASPAAGKLAIAVAPGKTVTIGSIVGRIEPAETVAAPERPRSDGAPKPGKAGAQAPMPGPAVVAPVTDAEKWLSPSARRLAGEAGVDVSRLAGTGRGGRVTREDVQTYLERESARRSEPTGEATPAATGHEVAIAASAPPPKPSAPPAAPGSPVRESRQPMSAIRLRIAERLVAAQKTAAILSTFNEADLSAILALRTLYKDRFKEKHGIGLGFMGFFVKACVEALQAFPIVNARIDGSDIVYHNFYNIAIAVSTDKGLMAPVVRDADRFGLAQIEKAIADLAQKARDGKITVSDLQGGTFTITNGGIFGSLLSTPLLNPPQSAILGMHAVQKRPIAVNDQVVIRPMMYLALSYDHRIIDGREAVQFLVRVKECLESPERLLLGV